MRFWQLWSAIVICFVTALLVQRFRIGGLRAMVAGILATRAYDICAAFIEHRQDRHYLPTARGRALDMMASNFACTRRWWGVEPDWIFRRRIRRVRAAIAAGVRP